MLFCVGLIVISEMFPDDTQALAAAVFNTAGQIGNSFGLAVLGAVAARVTQASPHAVGTDPGALEAGYRAAFWGCLALTLTTCVIATVTLRGVGRVGGQKEDIPRGDLR